MSITIKEQLAKIVNTEEQVVATKIKQVDSLGRAYATGKRKNAIAKVWLKKGNGKITVNNQDVSSYFGREILVNIASSSFEVTQNQNKFDVVAQLLGGGKSGQAGALLHGISKALVLFDPNNHQVLRHQGFLTRDSRVVERKKYGYKKARKGQTYRKR
jgi:small subunit ribosomal protein S9